MSEKDTKITDTESVNECIEQKKVENPQPTRCNCMFQEFSTSNGSYLKCNGCNTVKYSRSHISYGGYRNR